MNKLIQILILFLFLFFLVACDDSKSIEKDVSVEDNTQIEEDTQIEKNVTKGNNMIINQAYIVNPGDEYIPENNLTKLQVDYNLLTDSKTITLLRGKATLKQ